MTAAAAAPATAAAAAARARFFGLDVAALGLVGLERQRRHHVGRHVGYLRRVLRHLGRHVGYLRRGPAARRAPAARRRHRRRAARPAPPAARRAARVSGLVGLERQRHASPRAPLRAAAVGCRRRRGLRRPERQPGRVPAGTGGCEGPDCGGGSSGQHDRLRQLRVLLAGRLGKPPGHPLSAT